ncbi:MAG: hypothetical protein ACLRFE_03850, partial [Clostridia bacterium]
DLASNDKVIEIDISKSSPISAVRKYFSNVLHTEEHLYTIQFSGLLIKGVFWISKEWVSSIS